LTITGITKEELEKAPDSKTVWGQFVNYVNRFNRKKDEWNSPIAAGSNIEGYDLLICDRYNELFGPKKKDTLLFNTFKKIDLMKILFFWFEDNNELKNFKQETLREYFGWDSGGLHRAMSDVDFTAALIFRFMKFHRKTSAKTNFKNCFKK
jgi:DNA polymerase III epsilon subunit-like protein